MCGLSYGWLFGCMVEVKRITQPFDTFMVKFLQHAFFFQTTWIYAMWHFWIPLAVSMVVYHVEFTRWPTSEMLLGQFGSLAS